MDRPPSLPRRPPEFRHQAAIPIFGTTGDEAGGALLDGEKESTVVGATEVEVGIAPGVEFGRAA
jgi:hypothetical protein